MLPNTWHSMVPDMRPDQRQHTSYTKKQKIALYHAPEHQIKKDEMITFLQQST